MIQAFSLLKQAVRRRRLQTNRLRPLMQPQKRRLLLQMQLLVSIAWFNLNNIPR